MHSTLLIKIILQGFILLILLFNLQKCQTKKEKIKSLSAPIERPVQKAKDILILYSDSSYLKAILKATEMISYEKKQPDPFIFFPKNVQIIFYNSQHIPTSTLTANQSVYFINTHKAYLKYNVHFINDKHEHLITEKLVWNQMNGKITTDKAIKIITPTQIINGIGIECEEDFSAYTIKNITGIIQLNDSINSQP